MRKEYFQLENSVSFYTILVREGSQFSNLNNRKIGIFLVSEMGMFVPIKIHQKKKKRKKREKPKRDGIEFYIIKHARKAYTIFLCTQVKKT